MSLVSKVWSKIVGFVLRDQPIAFITDEYKKQIVQSTQPFRMSQFEVISKIEDLNDTSQNIKQVSQRFQQHSHKQKLKKKVQRSQIVLNQNIQVKNKPSQVATLADPGAIDIAKIKQLEFVFEELLGDFQQIKELSTQQFINQITKTQILVKSNIESIDKQLSLIKNIEHHPQQEEYYNWEVNLSTYPYELQYPILTLQQYRNIQYIFNHFQADVSQLPRSNPISQLSYKNFLTLNKRCWLNDQVINTYIDMMKKDTESNQFNIMNTFFSTHLNNNNMDKVIKRNNINIEQKLIIPIHYSGNHWLFVLIQNGVIKLHDSMNNASVPSNLKQLCKRLFGKVEIQVVDYPKQKGGCDCGVFMLHGIKANVYKFRAWGFRQQNINYKRLSIARDILYGVIGKIE